MEKKEESGDEDEDKEGEKKESGEDEDSKDAAKKSPDGDGTVETEEEKAVEDKESEKPGNGEPRALHKTASVFLRSIHPAVTKAEIEKVISITKNKRESNKLRIWNCWLLF